MKVITRQWLEYAQTDLKACENNLNDEFVTNIVAFHAQQAVEKATELYIGAMKIYEEVSQVIISKGQDI